MWRSLASVFLLLAVFVAIAVAHAPLLKLPYFWDEAGYYIPAAYDIFTKGVFIPISTLTNAHPPLVMSYLALLWKLFGYSPEVTRMAMLLVAAFALMGLFSLARTISNREVATGTGVCTALYPVFFAQSSMAHVDIAAAALSFWALGFYFRQRLRAAAALFVLAALAKETAIITPLALLIWELLKARRFQSNDSNSRGVHAFRANLWLLLPLLPLALWFAYHYFKTGYALGNPEFFRYNVGATLNPLRVIFALVRRIWQLVGHMNLYVLTLAAALAMMFPAVQDRAGERSRILIPTQLTLLAVLLAHLLFFSLVGGAPLARYMLTAVPLVLLICVSTIWRRVKAWPVVIALIAIVFATGLFINPPYVFAPEDNLSYRDYVILHQESAQFLNQNAREQRILTAWPGSDELSRSYLGYVHRPLRTVQLRDFSPEQLEAAARAGNFELAFVFSTKYEPPGRLWQPQFWHRAQSRFFDYHHDLPPEATAAVLGGEIVFAKHRGGHWVAVIRVQRVENVSAKQ